MILFLSHFFVFLINFVNFDIFIACGGTLVFGGSTYCDVFVCVNKFVYMRVYMYGCVYVDACICLLVWLFSSNNCLLWDFEFEQRMVICSYRYLCRCTDMYTLYASSYVMFWFRTTINFAVVSYNIYFGKANFIHQCFYKNGNWESYCGSVLAYWWHPYQKIRIVKNNDLSFKTSYY